MNRWRVKLDFASYLLIATVTVFGVITSYFGYQVFTTQANYNTDRLRLSVLQRRRERELQDAVQQRAVVEQYAALNNAGSLKPPNRLSMLLLLDALKLEFALPEQRYEFSATKVLPLHGDRLELKSVDITLALSVLHEPQLYQYLAALQAQHSGIVELVSMVIERQPSRAASVPNDSDSDPIMSGHELSDDINLNPSLKVSCLLRWYAITDNSEVSVDG